MTINIANPPVRFVPGIRIAELIHWSFHGGISGGCATKRQDPRGIVHNLSVLRDNIFNCCVFCLVPTSPPRVSCDFKVDCSARWRDVTRRVWLTGVTGNGKVLLRHVSSELPVLWKAFSCLPVAAPRAEGAAWTVCLHSVPVHLAAAPGTEALYYEWGASESEAH